MKNTSSPTRQFTRQHPLITGTLLLTAAGFISRIIGFFYRIYMSRLFGEEEMGIYQLIHPISALAFSLTAAAFQTAISKFVAERSNPVSKPSSNISVNPLFMGASIALPLSLLAAGVLYFGADVIALHYLKEPRTALLIRLSAFTLPFSAAHACINGYFYGLKQASVPAFTQLLEQLFRVGGVFFLSSLALSAGEEANLSLAVIGLIIGEIAGFLGALYALLKKRKNITLLPDTLPNTIPEPLTYSSLLSMVIPLTANRVVLNFLQSLETVALPTKLRAYGYDTSTALSVYGVLTGMAFPLIFFPNVLTSSISVLLLPAISKDMAQGRKKEVRKTIVKTIQYCCLLGFFCMAFFLFFGQTIGRLIFESSLAGYFICELSFLCPCLYLNSTLSGILQGLGKATGLFVCNGITLLLRLIMVYTVVPFWGIQGYLWALLISQFSQTALYLSMLFFQKKLAPHNRK